MSDSGFSREDALELLLAHTKSESLVRHAKCVEACMRHYAKTLGEDVELWGNTGLLHDMDYETHPEDHPLVALQILKGQGWPQSLINAIAAHYSEKTGKQPETPMERHLVACDELSGFIVAVACVRPSKDVRDVEVKSVKKKLKTPAFAAAVDREHLFEAAELIGKPMDEHIEQVLQALKESAEEIGLDGLA